MTTTAEAVLALAPDDASVKAAKALLSPSKWSALSRSERAVWGACQGSGAKPYRADVDLAGPAFQCTCPSRKFPCKHGLAVLLLHVQDASRFAVTAEPARVAEWIDGRREKAAKKESRDKARAEAAAGATPIDPEVKRAEAEARDARRWGRIESGAADLERWLGDLAARGIAGAVTEDREAWVAFAARMVDAQAPGLAQRIESAAYLVGIGGDWPARLLARLGTLQLLCDAIRRRAELPAVVVADLRSALGWPLDRDAVLQWGDLVEDEWSIVGLVATENERGLHERRVWLWGRRTGRRALVLEFAYGGGFATSWVVGAGFAGVLAFHPSATPLRALVLRRDDAAVHDTRWPSADPDEELRDLSARLAQNAWQPGPPLLVDGARIVCGSGETWAAENARHHWDLDLEDHDASLLLAASGGRPVSLWGEWTGSVLRPITAWGGEGLWMRSSEAEP